MKSEPVHLQCETDELTINGEPINLHDIEYLTISPDGRIIGFHKTMFGIEFKYAGLDVCKCGHFAVNHRLNPLMGPCCYNHRGEKCECQAYVEKEGQE